MQNECIDQVLTTGQAMVKSYLNCQYRKIWNYFTFREKIDLLYINKNQQLETLYMINSTLKNNISFFISAYEPILSSHLKSNEKIGVAELEDDSPGTMRDRDILKLGVVN